MFAWQVKQLEFEMKVKVNILSLHRDFPAISTKQLKLLLQPISFYSSPNTSYKSSRLMIVHAVADIICSSNKHTILVADNSVLIMLTKSNEMDKPSAYGKFPIPYILCTSKKISSLFILYLKTCIEWINLISYLTFVWMGFVKMKPNPKFHKHWWNIKVYELMINAFFRNQMWL